MNEHARDAFEKQLAALQPAHHHGEEATMLYHCGFAAGQASTAANHASRANHQLGRYRSWLPAVAAACLTAILVGPTSYRVGSSNAGATIAETAPVPVLPSLPPSSPPPVEPVPVESSPSGTDPPAPQQGPAPRPPAERPETMRSGPYRSVIASWLIGPSERPTFADHSANGVVLTSRPPSAEAIASMEKARPPRTLAAPSSPMMPNATPAASLQIRSLPSQTPLTDWESWIH